MTVVALPATAALPVHAAPAATIGDPVVNIAVFAVFITMTLWIAVRVSGNNSTASDYFAAGRTITGRQNGIAIAGDYLSAASFLGIAGVIALYGYDGFLYSIGFLVGWVIVLILVAEPLRNTGRYTLADVLAYRLRRGPVRTAAAVSTLVISLFYLLAQMAGAGALVSLLLGVSSEVGQNLTILTIGLLMTFYVLVGGMKGTTWVQIVKAVLLMMAAAVVTIWVLGLARFNIFDLFSDAAAKSASGDAVLRPGLLYGGGLISKINFVSLSISLVLGTAGLPHVLMRLYTVPNARAARASVAWATWIMGLFYLCTVVLGFGAMWLVGSGQIAAVPGKANAAVPLLAFKLGGTLLLAAVAAVAFATILAVVAGLVLSASASFAHDIYANVIKKGNLEHHDEVRVARYTAVGIGLAAILGGIYAKNQNVAFLVSLAFAVAASANLPTILYSLYWSRFTSRGALWSIYGGLISSITLIALSPVISGKTDARTGESLSMITDPGVNFAVFPLENPGIVSIPLAFFLGWLGSVTTREQVDPARFARLQVRSLTAFGTVKAARR
ncbi:MAG: cation acetate symporter [Dactylosporangium sp.]|nr:cation acetate symporter [Dactylosporangium sp.]NNJ61107.1 cation acetate symporter [Dactylosporangium sp.]